MMTNEPGARSRDVVRWHSIDELDWSTVPSDRAGGLEGASARLLSESDDARSQTWMLRVPAGWSGEVASRGVTELFVTAGELLVGSAPVGVGGFVGVPAAAGAVAVTSDAGADLLLFVNEQFDPEQCYPGGEVFIAASRQLPWEVLGDRGVAVKRLRQGATADPDTSPVGFLNLLLFLPGFISDEVEFHNTWEEMVYLDGDFFMIERGNAGTTSYHANPANALHGPFATQWGSLMLHHALEPYRTDFDHRPGGLERAAQYLDETPFDSARPKTERWDAYDTQHHGQHARPGKEQER